MEQDWPELKSYFEVIQKLNPDSSKRFYPGSPLFAQHFLRPQDKSTLFELHPADFELLKANIGTSSQTTEKKENGLKALLPLLPPKSRRGLILIDPSYEIKADFETVVQVIKKAHRRFANGIYALWYPVVNRERIDDLEKSFMKTGICNIQRFELGL